ncbi:MAG: hypothetical protein ACP5S8_06635 [Hydrogenobaculum sp.]
MDIKRLEGTSLNETILNSQPLEVSKESENLAIAIKTTVSQALLGALSDELSKQGFIEATVEDVKPNAYKLMLSNGVEIEVNAATTLDIKKNDILKLVISSINPLVLKIADAKSPSSPISALNKAMDYEAAIPSQSLSKNDVENSGLFYEKKLLDFILKAKDLSTLTQDNKYKLLQDIVNTAKDIKSLEAFKNLREDVKVAIENIANANITKADLETLFKSQSPPEDVKDILSLLLTQEPQDIPKDVLNYIPKAQSILANIEKNFIFNAKSLPNFVLELSSVLKNMPKDIKDIFFKSLQNILNIKNQSAKELLKSNPELLFDILNAKDPKELVANIQDNAFKTVVSDVLKDISSVKQDILNQISQNPVKVLEFSKHIKEALNNLQSNVSFDTKLNHLKENANTLYNINLAQQFILQNNAFFVNFEEGSKKGFGAFKKEENTYRAFIKLNWEDGFLGSILEMPKNYTKRIFVKFYTDIEPLSKLLESSKDELDNVLKEEGLNLNALEVFILKAQEFDLEVARNITQSSNLNIFT